MDINIVIREFQKVDTNICLRRFDETLYLETGSSITRFCTPSSCASLLSYNGPLRSLDS